MKVKVIASVQAFWRRWQKGRPTRPEWPPKRSIASTTSRSEDIG